MEFNKTETFVKTDSRVRNKWLEARRNKEKRTFTITLLFDSEASVSFISESFLKKLQGLSEEGDLLIEDADAGFARTAGGGSLKFMPYVASFELRFGEITIVFCRARVHYQNSNTSLLAHSDLPYNDVSMIKFNDVTGWKAEPRMWSRI